MTLHHLNYAPYDECVKTLLACCGSHEWASQMAKSRPFANETQMLDRADREWLHLGEADWLEAFTAHPRIGERTDSAVSQREQAAALSADDAIQEALRVANEEYERRFGFIFIVFASGKSAEEMLELLAKRLGNERTVEIRKAAAEQMKITRLRLARLLGTES